MNRTTVMTAVAGVAVLVPLLAFAGGNAQRGNALYHKNCASCHGNAGKGDGVAASALTPKPADLTNKAGMGGLDDAKIVLVIKKGGAAVGKSPMMPALGGALKDDEIADVVAYVRTLAK